MRRRETSDQGRAEEVLQQMNAPRHAPPWLFGITSIPYGIVGSFVATILPYLTRKSGISVDADVCVGCGLCEKVCPTEQASIVVVPRP